MPDENKVFSDGIRIVRLPKKYVKKLIPIEAVQWDGSEDRLDFLKAWTDGAVYKAARAIPDAEPGKAQFERAPYVKTLEGCMFFNPGDYIIRGIRGEYYPCEQSIFEESYEAYVD